MTLQTMPRRRRSAAAGYLLLLGLLALLGPSCDKMPLMAPSSSTLTLYAARVSVGLNGAVDVTATVIESAGTPVQNGTVVVFTTTLGSIDPVEARTNSGSVTVKFNSGVQSGTAEIRASSGGNTVKDALKISVGAAAVGKVELLANPTALSTSGGSVELTALVSDLSGNRLGGVPVSFTTDNGILGQTSVMTDVNGEARTTLTTTAKAIVGASVVGGTSGTVKSDNLTIPVRVGPTVLIGTMTSGVPGSATTISVTVTAGGAAVKTASINFGDGGSQAIGTAGSTTVSHVYSRGGTFIVTATAVDSAGETATATSSLSIQDVIVTISAFTVSPSTLTTAVVADFTVTAASSSPTAAPIERYEWNFGDGQTVTTYGSGFTSHKYGEAKAYTVSVRVVTTTGASATATKEIVVGGQDAGSVTISQFTVLPASPTVGTSALFTVVATATAAAGTIARYEWNFGDGTSITTTTAFTPHVYSAAIPACIVSVRVVTTTGAANSAAISIVVGGQDAGSVTITSFRVDPASPTHGASASFTVVATASATAGTIARYEWNFGDGTSITTGAAFTSHVYSAAIPACTVIVRVVTTTGAANSAVLQIVVL